MINYRITLHLFYIHSNKSFEDEDGNDNFIDEQKLTEEELDIFMKDFTFDSVLPRYMKYAQSITNLLSSGNTIRITENSPFDIDYDDNGILQFSITLERERTIEDIKRDILLECFEENIYEGRVGNECIVPTRQKYPVKYYNPEALIPLQYSMEYIELGKIDCRSNYNIYIQKLKF
jgi:hypothetical protein